MIRYQYLEKVKHGTVDFPFRIYTVNEFNSPSSILPPHWHNEIEFLRIDSGEAFFNIENSRLAVKAGDILIINPKEIHQAETSCSTGCHYTAFDFQPRLLDSSTNNLGYMEYLSPILINSVQFPHLLQSGETITTSVMRLLGEIQKVDIQKKTGKELYIKAYLLLIVAELYNCHLFSCGESLQAVRSLNADRMQKVLDYIHCNYANDISTEQMARLCYLSPSNFCRMFKECSGTSFVEFLNNYRVNMALSLLKEKKYTITQIANMVGFHNSNYFAKVFKKSTGKSPSQYL